MPYTLGGVTLPQPKSLTREFIEVANENITLLGKTTKNILHRKEKYALSFVNLSREVVDNILSEYTLDMVRSFTVDDTNMSIGPVDVLIDITDRTYPPVGKQYVENFSIILTEVI